jgi:hypothetical protein
MVDPNTATIIVAFGAMMGGFFAIAKIMLNQATKDRDADRAERKDMTKVFSRVADATERAADEAKDRNGHLGDLVAQGNQMTSNILSQLQDSAKIAKDAQADGGLVVRTEDKNPLKIK